jgi:hypothetical protein
MSLPLALGSHAAHRFTGRMNADLGAIKHLDARDIEGVAGSSTHDFDEAGNPDAHQLASRPFFRLLFPQSVVADRVQSNLHSGIVVSAVVGPAERRCIGKLVRSDEILSSQLDGIGL